jgi:hypothetical protein
MPSVIKVIPGWKVGCCVGALAMRASMRPIAKTDSDVNIALGMGRRMSAKKLHQAKAKDGVEIGYQEN